MADRAVKNTPWGDMEVADAHTHFFSPAFFAAVKKEKKAEDVAAQLGWEEPETPQALAARWVAELDTATIRDRGNLRAMYSDSDPQPHPSSSTSCPSSSLARSQVRASIASSAASSVSMPGP